MVPKRHFSVTETSTQTRPGCRCAAPLRPWAAAVPSAAPAAGRSWQACRQQSTAEVQRLCPRFKQTPACRDRSLRHPAKPPCLLQVVPCHTRQGLTRGSASCHSAVDPHQPQPISAAQLGQNLLLTPNISLNFPPVFQTDANSHQTAAGETFAASRHVRVPPGRWNG